MNIRLIGVRNEVNRQYNAPTATEIVALIVCDFGCSNTGHNIIIDHQARRLQRVSEDNLSFMALQYPFLFPYGEDRYYEGIGYDARSKRKKTKRGCITMREFYAYRIQQRLTEGQTLQREGRLFHQYIVDAYSIIKEKRLQYLRTHQKN